MKKLFALLLILPLFVACSKDDDNNNDPIVLTSISLDKVTKELNIGDQYQMTYTTKPEVKNLKVNWASSDTKVATVSESGLLKILSDGVTTITVSYGDLSSSDIIAINKVQDYTSFVFEQTVDNDLPNCVAAYKKDGKYYKLGDLGNLSKGKQAPEIRVADNTITDVYFFTDFNGTVRFNYTFKLIKNTKNVFKLLESMGGIDASDKSDPTKYPQ